MNVREVKTLNIFQRLVIQTCKELRSRGYDLHGATDERVVRVVSTNSACRELRNSLGHEWDWPESEQKRLAEVVRFNMAFKESRVYAFGDTVEMALGKCSHGKKIYCRDCWLSTQAVPPEHRRR